MPATSSRAVVRAWARIDVGPRSGQSVPPMSKMTARIALTSHRLAELEPEGARHLADRHVDQRRLVRLQCLRDRRLEVGRRLGAATSDAEGLGQLDEVGVEEVGG